MIKNKNHWYDGWIYDQFIAPNQDKLFHQIKKLIESNSKIIDVGCGTGRFSFYMKDSCTSIHGIDLSKRNIRSATKTLETNPTNNISFQHTSLSEIISEKKYKFDYAVMTYVIHEVNEEDRLNLLMEMAEIADKIIIGDYLVPRPKGYLKLFNEIVEFAAGSEHYRNYKSFVLNNGARELVAKSGLKILIEKSNNPSTSHILVLTK